MKQKRKADGTFAKKTKQASLPLQKRGKTVEVKSYKRRPPRKR